MIFEDLVFDLMMIFTDAFLSYYISPLYGGIASVMILISWVYMVRFRKSGLDCTDTDFLESDEMERFLTIFCPGSVVCALCVTVIACAIVSRCNGILFGVLAGIAVEALYFLSALIVAIVYAMKQLIREKRMNSKKESEEASC